jgi:type I restriction enzyme S subunit
MSKALQLPVGWKEKRLKDVGKCLTGLTYTPKDVTDDSGLLVLRSSNVQGGKLVFDDNVYVKRDVNVKNYAQSGDILVCVRNGSSNLIGKNAIVTADGDGLPHGAFMMLFRSKHYQYLYQLFSSEMYNKQVYRNLGATINSINSSDFYKFRFLFPPLPEQKAIAALLSTWDEAIEKTERLIQAKEAKLKGQIQKLISQRCDSWPHTKPKKIFDTITEKNFPDEELLSVTQDRGVIPRSMLEGRVMSPDGTTASYKLIKRGDFAISLRSFQGGIEYSIYQGIISPAYTVLRPKIELSSDFYRLFFKSYIFIEKYLNLAVIGIRDGKQISIPDFLSIKIPVPPLEQQKEIAETLSVCQHEIDLLKQFAEKYKTQKRGLMQKMLTGEWRVKPEIINQYMEA